MESIENVQIHILGVYMKRFLDIIQKYWRSSGKGFYFHFWFWKRLKSRVKTQKSRVGTIKIMKSVKFSSQILFFSAAALEFNNNISLDTQQFY